MDKHLGICTCNNRLNVHTGAYTATEKQMVYMYTCTACEEKKYRLERDDDKVRPVTKREQYYRALRNELERFEEENGRKPNGFEKLGIMYDLRDYGLGMYKHEA